MALILALGGATIGLSPVGATSPEPTCARGWVAPLYRIDRRGASDPEIARQRAAEIRQVIEHLISNIAAARGFWSCATGGCSPMSRQLKDALFDLGYELPKLIRVRSEGPIRIEGAPRGAVHDFLVDQALGESAEVIIDPTWKQFFYGNVQALAAEPGIFVGTREELLETFARFAPLIRTAHEEPPAGGWEPQAFVEKTYAFGRGAVHPFSSRPARQPGD